MQKEIKTITVYAASSSKIDPVYFKAAEELGERLAYYRITCINGAGSRGLMTTVSDFCLRNGGKVCGIVPRFMVDEGWVHLGLTELIVTGSMHERKELMAQKSDACIALPGGIGTMEELLEIITWKQLGLYTKPIVILNINHFYDDLLAMLEKAARENFMHHKHKAIWEVAYSPEEALKSIFQQSEWEENPRSFAAM